MAHDSPAGLSSVRARGGGALPLSHRQGGRRAEFVWRQRGSGGVVCGGGLLPARGQGPAAVHGRRSSRLHQQGHQRGHPREGARRSGGRRAPPVSALLSAVRPVPHPTLFLALCSPPLLPALKLCAPNGALSLHTHTPSLQGPPSSHRPASSLSGARLAVVGMRCTPFSWRWAW
jgi:hypothetical protein